MTEPMAGLSSIGVYVPPRRIPAPGTGAGTQRSLAGGDEDVLTMAVEAAHRCLEDVEPLTVGGLFFASTTSCAPHRPMAPAIATVCDLPRDIVTADFGGSARAGLSAVSAAARAVDGGARRILVVASDWSSGEPAAFGADDGDGDGAVAVVVDSRPSLGRLAGVAAVAEDLGFQTDDRASFEERRILRDLAEVIERAINECGVGADQVAGLAAGGVTGPGADEVARLVGIRLAGGSVTAQVGRLATAEVLLQLASTLEHAASGDRVVAVAGGAGAEALLLELGDVETARRPWLAPVRDGRLQTAEPWRDGRLQTAEPWRDGRLQTAEPRRDGRPQAGELRRDDGRSPAGGGEPSQAWAGNDLANARDVGRATRLYGMRCPSCSAVEFPGSAACAACGASAGLEPAKLAKHGTVRAVRGTAELTVDLFGGVRVDVPATDFLGAPAVPGTEVRLTFRRAGPGSNRRYGWKARPF